MTRGRKQYKNTTNKNTIEENNNIVSIKNGDEELSLSKKEKSADYDFKYKVENELHIPQRFSCVYDIDNTDLYYHTIVKYLNVYMEREKKEHTPYEEAYWDDHITDIHNAISDFGQEVSTDDMTQMIYYYFNEVNPKYNRNFASFANYKMISGILSKLKNGTYRDFERAGMINKEEEQLPFEVVM